jgi:SNF2 family DNA or RNA helicase
VILKAAVREFLNRELDDWSWYRQLDMDALNRRRDRLPVDPPIWNKLQLHQKQGLLFGIRLKKAAYWFDTGTGKTLMMLALARYYEAKGTLRRVLVLVPNLVNKEEWEREIEKHCPRMNYLILEGSSTEKWAALQDTSATVVIETYAGFIRLMATLQKLPGRKNRKLVRDAERMKLAKQMFNMIVLDESGAVGNRESMQYRTIKSLTWAADYVYLLNGTPFGRDPTPLWGQMHCIDRGATLGESLGLFRAAFFTAKPNGFGIEYVFNKDKSKILRRMVRHRSLRCQADAADLPRTVRIVKTVQLQGEADTVYTAALDSLRKSRGRVIELKNEFLRMRQISSGFMGYKDDDAGKAAQYEFKQNPKLELLMDYLGQVVDEYKAVVFNEFTFSGSMICREIEKRLGVPFARIYGGTKDPGAELRRFTEDQDCRVLVLQSAAGGMGLNLQVAKYVFYFESPVSPRVRKQTEARVIRQGSEHGKAYVYDFVARGVDTAILRFHAQGRDLMDAILNGDEML